MTPGSATAAILHGVWISGLVAVGAGLVLAAFPALSVRLRYRIRSASLWVCALAPLVALVATPAPRAPEIVVSTTRLVAAAPPVTSQPTGQQPNLSREPSAPPGTANPAEAEVVARNEARQLLDFSTSRLLDPIPDGRWGLVTLAILGLGALIGLLRLGLAIRGTIRLKRNADPISLDPLDWREIMAAADSRRRSTLLGSDAVASPIAVGYFRPAVLVPRELGSLLTFSQQRQVLLHEAVHLERRDDWKLLLQRLVEAILWFHPAVAWLARRLDFDRELLCDQAVVRRFGRDYARTLVELATALRPSPTTALAPGIFSMPSRLGRRVEELLGKATRPGPIRRAAFGAAAPVALALAWGITPVTVLPDISTGAAPRRAPAQAERAGPLPPATVRTDDRGLVRGELGEQLDRQLEVWADSGFSGTVLLVKNGEVVLERGYGLADRERGTPATGTTRYSLAGFTKAVTAAAIAHLAVKGKLSLDDPVSRYVPEITGIKGTATIDQLLTYRDGMARLAAPIFRASERDFLAALNATPIDFAPGTGFRYNDFGHSLLGIVIERVTGQRYEDYVRSHFFEPLDLELGFEPDGGRMAVEYQGEAGSQAPVGRRAWHWGRRASLGMVGTARDAHRWLEAIDRSTAISPALRQVIMAHRSPTDYGAIQTYGWELNHGVGAEPVLRRVAGTPGFEGEILRDDADGWSAVILVNSRLGWRFRIWRLIDRLAAS